MDGLSSQVDVMIIKLFFFTKKIQPKHKHFYYAEYNGGPELARRIPIGYASLTQLIVIFYFMPVLVINNFISLISTGPKENTFKSGVLVLHSMVTRALIMFNVLFRSYAAIASVRVHTI